MAGSGAFGPSFLKLGSGLPSMFDIQDMFFLFFFVVDVSCSVSVRKRRAKFQLLCKQKVTCHVNIH